jgi:hypothetical protein
MRIAAVAGGVGVAVCLVGALIPAARAQFFRSWLVAFCLVLGISLGALVLVMLNYVVGGNWGFVTRRFHEASTRTLPLVALFFLPVLAGLWIDRWTPEGEGSEEAPTLLFEWARPGKTDRDSEHFDEILFKKRHYLNPGFFTVRAVIYFAIWIGLAYALNQLSRRQDVEKKPSLNDWCERISPPGIVLYALTITFASIDWVMSLEPHWYSTIFMAIFGMAQILSGFTFGVAVLLLISLSQRPHEPARGVPHPNVEGAPRAGAEATAEAAHPTIPPPPHSAPVLPTQTLSDLGTLTMAFTMVWAYLSICQFLLIYSGNLPGEITYYNRRGIGPDPKALAERAESGDFRGVTRFRGTDPGRPPEWSVNGWTFVGMALIVLAFFLPFFLLLSLRFKRDRRKVAAIACWVLFMRFVDLLWLIVPAFEGEADGVAIASAVLLYPAALVGVGGLWLAFYLWQLRRLPLTPQYHPEEAAAHGQVAH